MLYSLRKTDIKQSNLGNILRYALLKEEITKPQLAKDLGMSMPTASGLVDELIDKGFLCISGIGDSTEQGGKKPKKVSPDPRTRHVLALHIGVGRIETALVNLQAGVVGKRRQAITANDSRDDIARKVTAELDALYALAKREGYLPIGLGVTSTGIVDPATGMSRLSANFAVLNGLPLLELLSKYGLPVWADNECRGIALAEKWFGAGKACSNFISLYTDTGIGAGFIINREIVRGTDNSFGEIGHMTIQADGPLCGCGNLGCWETYASPGALLHFLRERFESVPALLERLAAAEEDPGKESVYEAVEAGGPEVRSAAIDRLGTYLGIGITNLVNTFNPERVFLHGRVSRLGDELLERIRERVARRGLSVPVSRAAISFSSFGEDGDLIGAAALALEEAMQRPEKLFSAV